MRNSLLCYNRIEVLFLLFRKTLWNFRAVHSRLARTRGPVSRPGGRASPESGRIIALSFEESYCRTMRQVIDRHRTVERSATIFRKLHAQQENDGRELRDARYACGTPARGNSRENLAVFQPSPPADSDAIFLDHGHELPTWSDQGR